MCDTPSIECAHIAHPLTSGVAVSRKEDVRSAEDVLKEHRVNKSFGDMFERLASRAMELMRHYYSLIDRIHRGIGRKSGIYLTQSPTQVISCVPCPPLNLTDAS